MKKKSPFQTHRLARIAPQERDVKPFWVFDIETGLPSDDDTFGGSFVVGQFRCSEDKHTAYWVYSEQEALDFLLSRKCRGMKVYAHNGAGYDYKYLIRYLLQHKDDFPGVECKSIMRGDGRVICMSLSKNKHNVKLLDSFHVFPKSLKEFTRVFAPEYVKKEREWKLAGGSINWFNPDDASDREYLDYDCLGLIEAVEALRTLLQHQFGVNMAMTAAGTAMRAWRVTIPSKVAYWRPRRQVESFIRDSYAGGYVFLTSTEPQYDRVHVDINAAYAASMRKGVPVGTAVYTTQYREGYPGFYRCKVYAPTGERYPIVPRKTASGIQWSVGEFEATVPSCTIEYAQTFGYRFEIIDGYVFDGIDYPFQTFLERCEKLEIAHKKDAIGECAKLLRNSLYGRFGMRDMAERIIYSDNPDELMEPLTDKQTGGIVDDFFIEKELIDVPSIQIHWASWITALTRIRVHEIARASQASYGDTDSADMSRAQFERLVKQGIIQVGTGYGKVKVEHEFDWFVAHAPKDYIGYLSESEWCEKQTKLVASGKQPTEEDRYEHRAKAMPRGIIISSEHLNAPTQNVQKSYPSMISFKTLVKHPEQALADTKSRSYSTIQHSVSWRQLANGDVVPFEVHMLGT